MCFKRGEEVQGRRLLACILVKYFPMHPCDRLPTRSLIVLIMRPAYRCYLASIAQVLRPITRLCGILSTRLLFPSGVTPQSGDDWRESLRNCSASSFTSYSSHRPLDARAAVAGIRDRIETMGWHWLGDNSHRWLATGQSNGGRQHLTLCDAVGLSHLTVPRPGTWYGRRHAPYRIIEAAPISGHSSIQG